MRESSIEDYLHDTVRGYGGEYRRVKWIGRKHAPDDLIGIKTNPLWPHPPFSCWIECKRPGKEATTAQAREHDRMRDWGLPVHSQVSSHAQIDAIFNQAKKGK